MNKFVLSFIHVFFIFLIIFSLKADEIGTIEDVKGEFFYLDVDGNKIILETLDAIYLNQKYELQPNAELSISLNDGSYITFENRSEFIFTNYVSESDPSPSYTLQVLKGYFSIETGEIPKINKNASKILTEIGSLVLNGTAVTATINDEKSDIYLLTDSYGNKGELLLESPSGEIINVEIDGGISIKGEEINTVEISEEVKEKVNSLIEKISTASIVDETNLDLMIQKKLQQGKINDLNGDGVIDENDAILAKNQIVEKKQNSVDRIISFTSGNSELLSKVVDKSQGKESASILEKIISQKPDITTNVIETLVNKNPNKLTEISLGNAEIISKTVDVISKNPNTNDNQLSNILSKTDKSIGAALLEKVVDNKPDLLISVISKVSSVNPNSFIELVSNNQNLNNKVNNKITDIVTTSPEGKNLLQSLIKTTDGGFTGNILNKVNEVNPQLAKQTIQEAIAQNPQKLSEILSKNITNDNSSISDLIVKESIAVGKNDIISKAAEIASNNAEGIDQNALINKISEKINIQADILIAEGAITEEQFNQNLILQENLASPN